jgi:hypothetical protein
MNIAQMAQAAPPPPNQQFLPPSCFELGAAGILVTAAVFFVRFNVRKK